MEAAAGQMNLNLHRLEALQQNRSLRMTAHLTVMKIKALCRQPGLISQLVLSCFTVKSEIVEID